MYMTMASFYLLSKNRFLCTNKHRPLLIITVFAIYSKLLNHKQIFKHKTASKELSHRNFLAAIRSLSLNKKVPTPGQSGQSQVGNRPWP